MGISTRNVGKALKGLLDYEVSAQTVSNITQEITEELRKWRNRRLSDEYIYLLLDGVNFKYRVGGRVRKSVALVAMGIKEDLTKEIIDFQIVGSESKVKWEGFLNYLFKRGFEGKKLKLVITDGCPGLIYALDIVYPYVRRQRCWVHKLRNAANYMKKRNQDECLLDTKKIYLAESYEKGIKQFWEFAKKWRDKEPRAVRCIEKDLEELLSFFKVPKDDWKKVRTTNAIERSFREVRKRVRPICSF